ncbi:hypothetical protein M422DRAFT_243198 [Sphaerobolus stellatus SS14]|nr:hypothetical protein M422DRAFT_243198 [Sphaerobolus stellatus SS14]
MSAVGSTSPSPQPTENPSSPSSTTSSSSSSSSSTASPSSTSSASETASPGSAMPAKRSASRGSRPSFAISYSQPPPPSHSYHPASNAGMTVRDPNLSSGVYRGHPYARPQPSIAPMSTSAAATTQVADATVQPPKQFVVPAHPQSHHLHSLPPREKTTRTLILDHTAWRQGRTRFAQGRCELGMTVRFKNPEGSAEKSEVEVGKRPAFVIGTSSKKLSDFGAPPEIELASSDDEAESEANDGAEMERIRDLAYGKKFRHKRREARKQARLGNADSDEESSSSMSEDDSEDEPPMFVPTDDAVHAPALAARAAGMERVLHSMLVQRPSSPPRSPSPPPYAVQGVTTQSAQRLESSSNMLPNGLRLRLSLASLTNDLFERQSPFGKVEPSDESKQASPASSAPGTPLPPPSIPSNAPPLGLAALAQVSSQPFYTPPTLPSFHTLSLPSASSSGSTSGFSSSGATNGISSAAPKVHTPNPTPFGGASAEPRRPPPLFTWPRSTPPAASPATPTASPSYRTASYNTTADPSGTSSDGTKTAAPVKKQLPGSWTDVWSRAPRTPGYAPLAKRAAGRSRDLYAIGCYTSPSAANTISTFQRTVPTYSTTGSTIPKPIPEYPIQKLKTLCPRHLHEKCRICEPNPAAVNNGGSIRLSSSTRTSTTRIGAGLMRKESQGTEGSGCVLADLLPRFLRLSALVTMELGREARGEEPEVVDDASTPANGESSPSKSGATSKQAQPSRAWFALLCGLITRAVLEGYVARGWKGAEYAEILMGVGLGIQGVGTRRSASGFNNNSASTSSNVSQQLLDVLEGRTEYEPDEMPNLVDACKLLFSGLVQDARYPDAKEKATKTPEQEYVAEMEERMNEFLTVPHGCPDLATHLTGLSEKYPAEPIERAALRFCEAVSRWRGKPELEMYKKLNKHRAAKSNSATPLTLDSLLASTPVPNRPPIYKYFRISRVARKLPPPQMPSLKRQRSVDEDSRDSKKEKVEDNDAMDVDSEHRGPRLIPPIDVLPNSEWVGPYGV